MARRGENIYKRKDGRWEGRLIRGKGEYQYFYGKTYKELKEKMRPFLEAPWEEAPSRGQCLIKVGDLLEKWLAEGNLQIKPTTYESYYRCVNKHISPFFCLAGNEYLDKDTVERFLKYVLENGELAESSKKKILSVFKAALKCMLRDFPEHMPILDTIKLPKADGREIEIFTMKEQRKLEAAALASEDERALWLVLCFYSGIRIGELCALRWGDIDMESGIMSVMRTAYRTKNFNKSGGATVLMVGAPKSRKSVRKIPIPSFLLEIIAERSRYSGPDDTYLVSGGSAPYDPRSYQKFFARFLESEGIRHRKFHAIRHTFATRALELGIDIKTLSDILGHSNVSTTLNVYAHTLIEHKIAAIDKFNNMHIAGMCSAPFAVKNPQLRQ